MLHVFFRPIRRRAPNRRFTPSSPSQERGSALEVRSLAVPALWMQPFPPAPFLNQAITTAGGGTAVNNQNVLIATSQLVGNVGLNGAAISQTFDASIPPVTLFPGFTIPGTDFEYTVLSASNVADFANPGNGTGPANIGNYGMSATTSVTVQWDIQATAQSPVITSFDGGTAGWSRAYFLADDQAGPPGGAVVYNTPPEYLHETYDVTLFAPNPGTGMVAGGPGVALDTGPTLGPGGVPTGGVSVAAPIIGGVLGTPAVMLDGTPVAIPATPSGSATFTNATTGDSIHIAWTPISIHASTSFQIATLPYSNYNGVITGPPWFVNNATGLGMAGVSVTNDPVDQAVLTTNYGISFSNYPTTP